MKELRTMIRRLRTTTRGFLDDGADVAEQLLFLRSNVGMKNAGGAF